MAKFWFISAPLFGHLDWGGFLKTAQALRRRGHDVTWVSEKAIGGALAQAGVPFAPVRRTGWLWPPPPAPDLSAIPPQEAVNLRYRRALDTWLSENLVGEGVEALLELAGDLGKPDVIVTDPFLSAAALAAEALDVPLVVCGWPAMRDLNADDLFPVQQTLGHESQERIARLCARFGLGGANFAKGPTPSILSSHRHISYFSLLWYQAEADSLLPQTLFVGGSPTPPVDPPPSWLADIPPETPLALVTLGSVFTGDLGFFSWAAQAAARAGYLPVVVIGWNPVAPERKAELKAALPPGTRLLNWVPFDHVLPRVRLMFHHGGMGTTHAAIIHGIPQIAVPHAADQRGNARRIAQAKVGLNLSALEVQHGGLLDGARAITASARVLQNVRDLAAAFAALGGPERAADALETIKV
ncbi:MAG: glycosyltransferase family 1 protein [Chloroflexi bacterium]|nr:glycosyltransferase family 1 protein [Chloroflexota bacterium]